MKVNRTALAASSLCLLVLCQCVNKAEALDTPVVVRAQRVKSSAASVLSVKVDEIRSRTDIRGWDYAFDRLVSLGIDAAYLETVFSDPRMPTRDPLIFSLSPKESANLYRNINTRYARKRALAFFRDNKGSFRRAYEQYGVPESVLLSILQVESGCGSYTGNSRIFHRLVRLASAAAPDNIERNFQQKRRFDASVTREQITNRARVLEQMFIPHAAAAVFLARKMGVHPLDLRGSAAGAMGLPQFLPGNIAEYGVDGDDDGRVDLFNAPDAVLSVANYLHAKGWQAGAMSRERARNVVRSYNNSEPYISTVLAMAISLEQDGMAQCHPSSNQTTALPPDLNRLPFPLGLVSH